MSELKFPDHFVFGTSTAAAQIETAFEHDWQHVKARDGAIFERTTDHEKHFEEDAAIIASLAPSYRMSLQWSKLQRAPFAPLDASTVAGYHTFLRDLQARNVSIMMVLHHFTNPRWFAATGGWENEKNIDAWVDFARRVVDEFGHYVSWWNTFNEPNVYASYGWITGFFPPFKNNPVLAAKVVRNMSKAHDQAYAYIKGRFPDHWVGISHNATVFEGHNFLGWFPARLADWWFMQYIPDHFTQVDFFGMSYYTRITTDPMPITFLDAPDKMRQLGKVHDDIWEYHPHGLTTCLERYWKRYRKPIIITENGVCDSRDELRQRAILDYATEVHQALERGIDIRGYYWWSTWDNFEWHLGPSFRFGLYEVDYTTQERHKRKSAHLYESLAHSRSLTGSPTQRVASAV
jgi:beta-glucosidase